MEKDSSFSGIIDSHLVGCAMSSKNNLQEVTYEACVRDPRQVIRHNGDGTRTFGKYDLFTIEFIPN